ncbi:hypothetical protein Y032_0054g2495 [Ancylostoma ceylanicum]|uniref:Uncharacterized protein n=1 Tax=Ancylostoma ceylanicum TaxID=53326 RepID=A0A016U5U0_9BILA|nr:hypothetical protein Y032_0054g2495 [Ancylostoma ceylanicum]
MQCTSFWNEASRSNENGDIGASLTSTFEKLGECDEYEQGPSEYKANQSGFNPQSPSISPLARREWPKYSECDTNCYSGSPWRQIVMNGFSVEDSLGLSEVS